MRLRLAPLTALALLAARPAGAEPLAEDTLRESVVTQALDVKVKGPAEILFDPARLGHVSLPTRVSITNRGAAPVPLDPKGLRFAARGSLAAYACDGREPRERWPETIAPGETLTSDHVVTCETALPGRHELEVRWASASASDPEIAVSAFTLKPGATPPVHLSSRPELVATVTGSRAVRPSNEPGKVRMVLGIVNAGPTITTLSTLVVDITLRQKGKTFSCRDRRTVSLSGMLGTGKMHVVWLPLGCAVPYEGDWETTVEIGEPGTPMVRLQRHVVRVQPNEGTLQTSPPR